jgi:aspartyl-tRNA(Asn)/glutamyl-tRNA(Gln) amidotransferase subunit C
MSVSRSDVHYIAALARLRFSDADEQRLAAELSRVLSYVEQLGELDTTGVPPMAQVLDLQNVLRADEVNERISRDGALALAPDADGEYFRVPKVIE